MSKPKRNYGWRPDIPDQRDCPFLTATARQVGTAAAKLPAKVDNRAKFPLPPYDQGALGSCTANAVAGVLQEAHALHGYAPFAMPSRLFIYYNERLIEDTVGEDSGATIRDSIKAVAKYGYPPEEVWPYVVSKFANEPPAAVYSSAKPYAGIVYRRLNQALAEMRLCLAAKQVFTFGFSVYESFESAAVAKTGTVPMPKAREQLLGGHAVVGCGYDDKAKRLLCRNSWGTAWGRKGYFTLPYAYVTDQNLAADFWTISNAL